MKPIAAEWIAKAEGDFAIMERECLVTENPNYDGICFHTQQRCRRFREVARNSLGLET